MSHRARQRVVLRGTKVPLSAMLVRLSLEYHLLVGSFLRSEIRPWCSGRFLSPLSHGAAGQLKQSGAETLPVSIAALAVR